MNERDKILGLPHRHHPKFAAAVDYLAGVDGMTAERAHEVLEAVRVEVGITQMEVEMAAPGEAPRVPFAPMSTGRVDDYQQGVATIVRARLAQAGNR